jgi:hypothetical protein
LLSSHLRDERMDQQAAEVYLWRSPHLDPPGRTHIRAHPSGPTAENKIFEPSQ